MPKTYHTNESEIHYYKEGTMQIGNIITRIRNEKGYEIEDLVDMTGLSGTTIRNAEKGSEIQVNTLIGIALALGVHPRELIDIEIKIEPLHSLSVTRKEKSRLTSRINLMIADGFFKVPVSSASVVQYLAEKYGVNTQSKTIAVILGRKVEAGSLQFKGPAREKLYYSV